MNYQQLTEGRRYQISALLERGISVFEIAKTVQCNSSTAGSPHVIFRSVSQVLGGNFKK
jgi:hypothetical protein